MGLIETVVRLRDENERLQDVESERADLRSLTDAIRSAIGRMGERCPFGERCAKCEHTCNEVKTLLRLGGVL